MDLNFVFFFNSILLGVGLAMDAFSVSLANGLNEPNMKIGKMCLVSGIFGVFQGLMPLLGWVCIHTVVQYFHAFEKLSPWLALGLLGFIGGKMLLEGIREQGDEGAGCPVGLLGLLVQAVATSIDALSVGFTIADYDFLKALYAVQIIAVVTFIVCFAGVFLGKEFGTRFAGKASILGGTILVGVGVYLLLNHLFFS